MRGQGYDDANNMRGSWNGLQTLFLKDCSYAYYVHCFAHRLQLTLVSAPNDIGNLQRAGGTRWSSHFSSVKSLIDMYAVTCKVLEYLSDHSPKKFYPEYFKQQDIYCLKVELQHYQNDVISEPRFQVPILSDFCRKLVASRRRESYVLLTKLICLVLTLPISTATMERAFSAMKHVKTKIRNKMDDDFLADCLTLNIEREFSMNLDLDSIIDNFYAVKHRRVQLQ
ncbi:uncharacterized protein LOC111411555 [Olea europaea var. sylvestris]|uniref:uncharacterized protein LOC111411555 n=1 Tax=Olea europaea var. sylvestris TaxID=158386 RepID=UPI000C1CF072|nr:uncharacterized protein LOC111411555 [Olea europaea var. sylvestris]